MGRLDGRDAFHSVPNLLLAFLNVGRVPSPGVLAFHSVPNQVKTILSPAFSVMIAFFQLGAWPACLVRCRRNLPRTFSVFTFSTFTLNKSCTACRICVLFARGSATTVY